MFVFVFFASEGYNISEFCIIVVLDYLAESVIQAADNSFHI